MKKGIKSKLALLLVLALCVTTMPLNVTASQIEDEVTVTEGTSEEAVTEEVMNEEEPGIEDTAGLEENVGLQENASLEENCVAELPDESVVEETDEPELVGAANGIKLSGTAHVQGLGDIAGKWDAEKGILTLGTTGQSKRLEAVTINLENTTGYKGTLSYRVHRQTYGWTDYVEAGNQAGTTGQAKRLEAIQISLTGELARHYSVKYRVHIQSYGWNQGWQYNRALAGTEGEAKRLESLEIQIVPRTEEMGIEYRVHRQTYGWEPKYKMNGEISGTVGEGKRLEGIEIALTGNKYDGYIRYNTHVQSLGWLEDPGSDGTMAGTVGKAKRLEAITIELGGEASYHYDIYYRVHAQSYGWLGWTKNGGFAGTLGLAKRLEAIQVVLVKKGDPAPSSAYKGAVQKTAACFVTPSSSMDLVSYVNKYGYTFGKGVKEVAFTQDNGSVLDVVINVEGTDIYEYEYRCDKYRLKVLRSSEQKNNYIFYLTKTEGGETPYFTENYLNNYLFKNDTGYEINEFSFTAHYGGPLEDETVDNAELNQYVREGVANINKILKQQGNWQIIR